jgi:hypothetical protein
VLFSGFVLDVSDMLFSYFIKPHAADNMTETTIDIDDFACDAA